MRDPYADQAMGLRRLFAPRSRITFCVAGEGSTAVTLNLAAALARSGRQVLVLDTTKGEAAATLGLRSRYELAHVQAGDKRLSDVLLEGPEGSVLLPAARGLDRLAEEKSNWQERVAAWLDPYCTAFDVWLVNGLPAAGLQDGMPVLFVVAPSASAVTAAYTKIKSLALAQGRRDFRVVVRQAPSESSALATFRNVADTAKAFLSTRLDYCGYIPRADRETLAAVGSPSGRAFARLAESVVGDAGGRGLVAG